MLLERRGLSAVIATILLVLMTITAIAILAAILVPFVRNTLNKSTECVSFRDSLKFDEPSDFNCYASNKNAVSVKLNQDQPILPAFKLIFISKGMSEGILINNTSSIATVSMMSDSILTSSLQVPEPGEIRTYVYSANQDFEKVGIYPVLNSGRICEASDSVDLTLCNSEVTSVIQ